MPRLNAKLLLTSALTLLAPLALAEKADSGKPINVDAGRVSQDQKTGRSVLEGGVRLVQGTLSLDADQAVITEQADGEQTVQASGRPVKFKQKMEGQEVWLDARSDKLDYDSKTGDVKLTGNAWLKRGQDELSGSHIVYNSVTEIFRAEGNASATPGTDGRVKLVIQPKKKPESQAKP
ncbi:lipopolysaccharide transport periplasmic protein LptA [Chitinimonas viridis]|uniref:Lipopolysaccharide export system protein LptA n=2 Tax=Chitinimonas TaxID=240411 RepID=A0ABT8B127_9NEIS|nr:MULTISPECIES: lipopolysaccharide transport periplasmic protein LptA [Chitinimonas]MDN3575933.1 lipopolysaccharide transport periplasmic protein LptA [Chitinimonas viridis]GLR14063.1 lipopolysaccharide export system protein LptA [Chitinimonas prasina]